MTIDIPDSLGRLMYDDNVTEYTKILLDIFAKKAHTHSQSDITGLSDVLAGFLTESALDNVLKIRPGNWGYTRTGSSNNYKYNFDSIEIGELAIFSGSIQLFSSVMSHDALFLPSGGEYLVYAAELVNSPSGIHYPSDFDLYPGGGKFARGSSDEPVINRVIAIRLS